MICESAWSTSRLLKQTLRQPDRSAFRGWSRATKGSRLTLIGAHGTLKYIKTWTWSSSLHAGRCMPIGSLRQSIVFCDSCVLKTSRDLHLSSGWIKAYLDSSKWSSNRKRKKLYSKTLKKMRAKSFRTVRRTPRFRYKSSSKSRLSSWCVCIPQTTLIQSSQLMAMSFDSTTRCSLITTLTI